MTRAAAALAPLLVVLLAGCGSAPELSDTQLRVRATSLCSASNRKTARIDTPGSPAAAEAFLKRGIAVLTPELAGLRGLRAPGDLADVYQTSVDAFSRKLDALRSTVGKLRAGQDPVVAMKTLQQRLTPIESTEDGAWSALRVPACLNR
jgi:hypothetical protein